MAFNKICVIGLGYIGLPTACMFATHGIDVVGMDNNPDIIKKLSQGDLHIFEPGLKELVEQATKTGHLRISNSVEPADAFIITVPTPFFDDKKADMRYVEAASTAIIAHLRPGNLVILESTSPPRTTVDRVRPILEKSGLVAGKDFYLVYSPERVLPGKILDELIHNARVIGGITSESAEAGKHLYSHFVKGQILLTDSTTAEMVKLIENTTRDINIAIANEFCRLADRFGVDVWEAIELANLHPRINILKPGIGVGGHCISVDPWFLVEAAPEESPLVLTARKVNDDQPEFVCKLIERDLGPLQNLKIAFLGLAFKPDVDDLRESPAVILARLLTSKGVDLEAYEPFKPGAKIAGLNIQKDLSKCLKEKDLIILAVGHQQFKTLDPIYVKSLTDARSVYDAVNGWDKTSWEEAGFKYFGMAKN